MTCTLSGLKTENSKNMGLWNSRTKSWEIKPEYHSISVLDTEQQIYALQKEKDGLYTLYDNENKKSIGLISYKSVNSDGLVNIKNGFRAKYLLLHRYLFRTGIQRIITYRLLFKVKENNLVVK